MVLELDDVREIEELEDLEQGREGEDDYDASEEFHDALESTANVADAPGTFPTTLSPTTPSSVHSLALGQTVDRWVWMANGFFFFFYLFSFSFYKLIVSHKYVKGPVPVLPYCGCESMSCHLLPSPRQLEDIHVIQVRRLSCFF